MSVPVFAKSITRLVPFLLVLLLPATGQAKCIKVEINTPAPVVDRSWSGKSLANGYRAPKWATQHWDSIAGRFEGEIEIDYSEMQPAPPAASCGSTPPFVMALTIKNSILRIAQEVDPNGCWFNVVRAHEYKHYQSMVRGMQTAAPRLEAAVEAVIAQHLSSAEAQALVYRAIETELNAMYAQIDQADEQVDDLAAVIKENEACGGGSPPL